MGTGTIVLIAVAVILVIKVSVIVSLRNGIVQAKNRVQRAWANVLTYERRKLNVIPAMSDKLKEYQEYEAGLQRQLTELRGLAQGLSEHEVDVGSLKDVEECSRSLLAGIKVAVEAYPELKTSELYAGWMKELAESEDNVAAAIVIFNAGVQGFNDRIQMFPGNWVNALFNKERSLGTFTDSEASAGIEFPGPQFGR
jgi:LemA protein